MEGDSSFSVWIATYVHPSAYIPGMRAWMLNFNPMYKCMGPWQLLESTGSCSNGRYESEKVEYRESRRRKVEI